MIEVKGKNNTAVCFTDALEENALDQIQEVCDRMEFSECKIRIMPDVHAGAGCVIGTTMTIKDKIVPNMVGVDIGCGMETVKLKERHIDYDALDRLIREKVPSGRSIRDEAHKYIEEIDLNSIRCGFKAKPQELERARKSLGTLGGGNHFIEIDKNDKGELYLVVHSGSRHLGLATATWYQGEAYSTLRAPSREIAEAIEKLKEEGRQDEIPETLKRLKSQIRNPGVPKHLAYVEGQAFDDYISDMKIVQTFAVLNRLAMTEEIIKGMGLTEEDRFTTIHNYIDTEHMILRKGSVSARDGERILIPINMRDGSLICVGKGNNDWNESAPHGAGRLLGRRAAMRKLSMKEFTREMEGIFTTCVNKGTLDESPMAYKSMDEIVSHIGPTADIIEILKPTYNFKAIE